MEYVALDECLKETALSWERTLDKHICARKVKIDMNRFGDVLNMEITGGCGGQNELLSKLFKEETVPSWYLDVKCGSKSTSCVAEIAKTIEKMQEQLMEKSK
jgi:hypothetical protein